AVIDSLRCLKAFTEQPRKTSGCGCEDYQYVTSRGTTCVPWDTLVYAVKQSISLVKRMEAEDTVKAEGIASVGIGLSAMMASYLNGGKSHVEATSPETLT
ncbi:MAG: hypothetical protein QGF00_35505, partial [Planctomycetota bacterium]|nr:hypothetical protein [Planctomycetota bacterium]